MRKTSDELENEGLIEICKACNSINLKEHGKHVICGDCGSKDFTKEIKEEELNKSNE